MEAKELQEDNSSLESALAQIEKTTNAVEREQAISQAIKLTAGFDHTQAKTSLQLQLLRYLGKNYTDLSQWGDTYISPVPHEISSSKSFKQTIPFLEKHYYQETHSNHVPLFSPNELNNLNNFLTLFRPDLSEEKNTDMPLSIVKFIFDERHKPYEGIWGLYGRSFKGTIPWDNKGVQTTRFQEYFLDPAILFRISKEFFVPICAFTENLRERIITRYEEALPPFSLEGITEEARMEALHYFKSPQTDHAIRCMRAMAVIEAFSYQEALQSIQSSWQKGITASEVEKLCASVSAATLGEKTTAYSFDQQAYALFDLMLGVGKKNQSWTAWFSKGAPTFAVDGTIKHLLKNDPSKLKPEEIQTISRSLGCGTSPQASDIVKTMITQMQELKLMLEHPDYKDLPAEKKSGKAVFIIDDAFKALHVAAKGLFIEKVKQLEEIKGRKAAKTEKEETSSANKDTGGKYTASLTAPSPSSSSLHQRKTTVNHLA